MRFKLYTLVVICTLTPIRAAFKDFVIENENDLQRFGLSNADEELEYQYLDEMIYNEEDGIYGALGSSCDAYDDNMISDSYDIFQNQNNGIISNFEGKIDDQLLREIIRQLINDPRYHHLKDFITEDNLLVDYNVEKINENYLTHDYVDYYEDEQNYWYDDI